MTFVSKVLRNFTASLAFVATGIVAYAAQPPAGTVISNQATATYLNTEFGIVETVRSNRVSATILPVPAFEVIGGDTIRLTRGTEGTFAFRVRNTGNMPLSVDAGITENSGGDDFDVAGTLYVDANDNGVVDSGDYAVTDRMPVDIDQGDTVALLYVFLVPNSVEQDDRAVSTLRVTAQPILDPDAASPVEIPPLVDEVESITLIDEQSLRLEKIATYNQGTDSIEYLLRLRNNSGLDIAPYAAIANRPIIIDGVPQSVILVRDEIPLNTTFAEVAGTGSFDAIYHITGNPEHTYVSTPPADPARINAIAFTTDETYIVGRATDLVFRVRVNDNIGDAPVVNTATAYLNDGGAVISSTSNEVETPVVAVDGELRFFDPGFTTPIEATNFDEEVAIQLIAGSCNITREIDEVFVTVTTALSNDSEVVLARETGPNTGIFRTAGLAVRESSIAFPSNTVLEPKADDSASASATCRGSTFGDEIVIEPGGYVFDSITNAPISGARVELFPVSAGGTVGTVALQAITTDQNGFYSFGPVPQGTYNIVVTPPTTYNSPSRFFFFDGFERDVSENASYGRTFTFDGGPLGNIDIPVDPADTLPLTLDKTANRDEVRRGEYVVYTVNASNLTGQGLTNATIEDRLPPGFIYIAGSTAIDGVRAVNDPEGSPGRTLTFALGTIRPDSTVELEYTVRVAPTAGQGRRTNTAILSGVQARTALRLTSQPARAIVRVDDRGSVFADEAAIIGRVFLDINGDGVQDSDDQEPGVPGVKLVTSDGLTVVTDEEGRYSLFGLRPTTQVLAVQKSTLPGGAEIALSEIDDAQKPGSRFVDVKRGELRGEDFPVVYTEEVARLVAARREAFRRLAFSESLLRDDLPLTFDGGTRSLSSQTENALDTTTDIDNRLPTDLQTGKAPSIEPRRRGETEEERKLRLSRLLPTLSPEFGFVGLDDEMVAEYRSIDVLVKSPAETDVSVSINGQKVPGTKIGAKLTDRSRGIQLFEYIAIPLQPGRNTISTTVTDPFGNERGRHERTVYAPGAPAGLEILAPPAATADSNVRVPVLIRVVDADGRLVRAPVTVTLDSRRGDWDVRDIRPQQPGLQSFIDNGEATFDFIPPALVGRETLYAESEFGRGEAEMAITPDLGERTFVGIIEGAVKFGSKGRDLEGLMDSDDLSYFEETTEGLRGQVYLKGRILGDSLLTLRYNSDQDTNERLFRDIARDEYYPVYGDNSERGFDAQSSTRLFVKVERGQSYILYGDIAVEPESDAIRLGAYRRSLTGGKARYENGPVSITAFVAETELDQRIVEIPSRGVSGPYDVDLAGLRDGSEIVEIITRDRDQPSVIVNIERQRRLSDYSIDYFSGALIFNNPVSLSDDDLNPVSIRITYETEDSSGEKYYVYGGEARYEVTEDISVGYRELRTSADRGFGEKRTIRSAYVDANLGAYGELQLEATRSTNDGGDSGDGYRASYDYSAGQTTVRAELAHTDEEFDVPGSYVSAGRDEARIKAQTQLDERTQASADALYTSEVEGDRERYGVEALVTRSITEDLDGSIGMRAVRTNDAESTTDVLSGIVGLRYSPPYVPGASLLAEYEQDLLETDNWRLTTGADYQWTPDVRVYALNEFSSTESGFFGIGDNRGTNFTTKVGIEYRAYENLEGFSEYRSGGTSTGNGFANGLRYSWQPSEVTTFTFSAEHVEPLADEDQRRSAATVGMDYNDETRGIITRGDLQWDRDENGYGFFSNLAFGYRIDTDFTVLFRNRLAYDDKREQDRTRDRLRFGLAYRPKDDNRLRVLGWYEYEIDKSDVTEQAHRWSLGGTWTESERLRTNWRYAGEHTEFNSDFVNDSNTLHMGQLGMEYEFSENRVALAGNVALFTDQDFENYTVGIGAEIKVNVTENFQLGVGYNHVDLEEDRIRDLYNSGFYLRGKIKLDEDMWDVFDDVGDAVIGIDR
mgnify:CR=1 FL=1